MVSFTEQRKLLMKSTLIYTGSNAINSAIPFLLLPILTRQLTQAEYGILATYSSIIALLLPIIGFSTPHSVRRSFFDLKREELSIYIGSISYVFVGNFLLLLLFAYIFRNPIGELLKFPSNLLLLVITIAAADYITRINLVLCQVNNQPFAFGTYRISQTALNVGLSLLFVVALGWRWQGRLLGIFIAFVSFGVLSVFLIRKRGYVTFRFNREYVKDALCYSLPIVPHALALWGMNMANRLFLNAMVGLSATGVFQVGYLFGLIIFLVQDSFHLAWLPWFFGKLKQGNYDTKVRIVKFTYLYFVCILLLGAFLSWIAPLALPILVGKNFEEAAQYVLWITLGFAFNGMYKMVMGYILYEKKTYLLTCVTGISSVVGMTLTHLLIRRNGAVGAAQALFLAHVLSFLLTWVVSIKIYTMPWLLIFNPKGYRKVH